MNNIKLEKTGYVPVIKKVNQGFDCNRINNNNEVVIKSIMFNTKILDVI